MQYKNSGLLRDLEYHGMSSCTAFLKRPIGYTQRCCVIYKMRVWKEDDWPCLEQAPKVWGDNDDNGPPGGRGMLWTLQLMPCEDIPKPFAYQLLSAFCCSGQWLL